MLYDTHSHIYFDSFEPVKQSVRSCRRAGLEGVMAIGINRDSTDRARKLSASFPRFVHYTAGFHPTSDLPEEPEAQLNEMLDREPAPVAVGECGVDLHHDKHPVDVQQDLFRVQIELARERDLPVVVHQREAGDEVLEVVRDYPGVSFIFHCFDGHRALLDWGKEHGAWFGFTGNLTYGGDQLREAARQVPLDRVLVETDSPFLAPEPWRGRDSFPPMVVATAGRLADLRGFPLVELAARLNKNAESAFRLDTASTSASDAKED